jgi:endonuclease YncB( thermonuclease family)
LGVAGLGCLATQAEALACQVTRVVDGDTLHLSCDGVDHRVRLLGYDSPEVFHPHCIEEKQAGEAATGALSRLLAQGPLTLIEFHGKDRYGRDLANLSIAGLDVAQVMLQSALALPYSGHRHPDWCSLLNHQDISEQ